MLDFVRKPATVTAMALSLTAIAGMAALWCRPGTPDFRYQEYSVRWNSMSGILSDGQTVRLRSGEVRKGDVVVLKTGRNKPERIVKRVVAAEWDAFAFESGAIMVNGEILKNSTGIPYRLTSKMLELYAKQYPRIPKNSLLVMGNDPDWSYDSSIFGFADDSDVIGIVNN